MTRAPGGRALVQAGSLIAGLAVAAAVLHAGDRCYPLPQTTARVLYLQSGRTAGRLMLSFDALAADVYWIRTIQHYGRDRKATRAAGRFELLYPLLDLTTTLDPYFNIAYRFGAIFLAEAAPIGPDRADLAIALLQKGLAKEPSRWTYALDIGFVYYWYGRGHDAGADFNAAAEWFERAAVMPGAPAWLRPLAAVTRVRGGDRAGARRLLNELAQSEEAWIRRAAGRGLQQIQALEEMDALQGAVDRYITTRQTPPARWSDLIRAGLLSVQANAAPTDPAGVPYEYDAATHTVSLSPKSPLGPLPRALNAK